MPATPANALNATSTGVLRFDGTSAFNASTITQHDVLIGGASNAITSVSPSTSGFVLTSNGTGSDPSFQSLTKTTQGTWTPTAVGNTTAGTNSYGLQKGYYTSIGGNIVFIWCILQYNNATGTGDILLGGFPFTIKNQSNYTPVGPIRLDGTPYPANTVTQCVVGQANTTTGFIYSATSGGSASRVQQPNSVNNTTIWFSMVYQY